MNTYKNHGTLSKAEFIAAELRQNIKEGVYCLHGKLPDERELAAVCKASRGTVRKALDLLEQERLIIRRQGKGTFAASSAPGSANFGAQSGLIGVMTYAREYYFDAVIRGVARQAEKKGYSVILGTNESPEEERFHMQAFINSGISGFLMAPYAEHSYETFRQLRGKNIPGIFLGPAELQYEEDFVSVDDSAGFFLAVEHLYKLGHRKIGYIGTSVPVRSETLRRRGFVDACTYFGLTLKDAWIRPSRYQDLGTLAAEMAEMPDRPTAFAVYNDQWAMKFMKALNNINMKVPEQVAIAAFDNSREGSEFVIPLTSVYPRNEIIGATAADLLIDRMANKLPGENRSIMIRPELIVRKSSGESLL